MSHVQAGLPYRTYYKICPYFQGQCLTKLYIVLNFGLDVPVPTTGHVSGTDEANTRNCISTANEAVAFCHQLSY